MTLTGIFKDEEVFLSSFKNFLWRQLQLPLQLSIMYHLQNLYYIILKLYMIERLDHGHLNPLD